MARSRAGFLLVVTIALVGLIVKVSPAEAGTIVQTASFSVALHNTTFGTYQQFDPKLGTLTSVEISVSGSYSSPQVAFLNTSLTDTVSYNGFVNTQLLTDAGPVEFNNAFSERLSPGGESFHDNAGFLSPFNSYSDVGFWIGTGTLETFQFAATFGSVFTFNFGADDPRINTSEFDPNFLISGGETITYFFQPFGVPEPPSLVMFATAALVMIGLRGSLGKPINKYIFV
jgi:hypothetical protein